MFFLEPIWSLLWPKLFLPKTKLLYTTNNIIIELLSLIYIGVVIVFCHRFTYLNRERVDDFSFFDCSSPFCFSLIEFHCAFSISYKILLYFV